MTALHGKHEETDRAEAPRRWEGQGIREGRKRITFRPTRSGLTLIKGERSAKKQPTDHPKQQYLWVIL